jgi:flagellar basal body-associated protein FliL
MERTIHEAIQAIEAGDKRRAHSLLLGLIQEQPDNVLAWLWMAEVYSDPKNKKDCYIRALQIDPENEVALAHMKAIKYQEAMEKMDAESQADNVAETTTNVNYGRTGAGIETKPKKKAKPIVFVVLFLIIALAGAIAYIVLDKRGFFDRWNVGEPTAVAIITEIETATSTVVMTEVKATQVPDTPTPVIENTEAPTKESVVFEPTKPTPDPNNLIQNGYFLEDFESWERVLKDSGGSAKASIENSGNSPFNRMLVISQEGLGHVGFLQTVPVNNTDLVFSCKLYTYANDGGLPLLSGSGFSILAVSYLNADKEQIGLTRYLNVNEDFFAGTNFVGAPEAVSDTNTVHNIRIASGEQLDIYLRIKDEISSNLLGVDITEVKYIRIALLVGSQDKKAKGILQVSDILLKER